MELPVSSDCGVYTSTDRILFKDGNPGVNMASSSHDIAPQQPAIKQTRQWAAWTRQEEERFFTALRQVGKNFEKITYRVQSKNKDQVRHYYYRLVRRMNKLLDPQLCLDASNSKDTNSAMLRWWSLLEKSSCKASKLHLKPRRFKMFLDALEHQLLKDRRKNIRKRHSQGEVCSTTATANVLSQGVNRSNCKGDLVPLKAVRQRRKPAAYKRWEKAAIAGVSLVADAAEHLERTALDEISEQGKGGKCVDPVGNVASSSATLLQTLFNDSSAHTPSKLKLQLFPIDESTRKALEMDDYNPHLELTLSTRKRISSVLEHLNRKWGMSSIACGELLLLPYCAQKENLVNCQRWTQDSILSAADVYKQIGSPSIFRLRYCWLSNEQHELLAFQAPVSNFSEQMTKLNDHQNVNIVPDFTPEHVPRDSFGLHGDKVVSAEKFAEVVTSTRDVDDDIVECIDTNSDKNIVFSSENAQDISLQRESCDLAIMKQAEKNDTRLQTGNLLTPGDWADSLTNISIGDLLNEASDNMETNYVGPSNPSCQYEVSFSCDSFDAAIAALMCKNQDKAGFQPTLESHAPSIWDADETCDAFSFKKRSVSREKVLGASTNDSSEARRQCAKESLIGADNVVEELSEMKELDGDPMDESHPDPSTVESSAKEDFTGLSDLCWSESLAPLDLDRPCKYHNEDLILHDSMSGLNRLIASSLDAFQNCSFFGLDKRESAPTSAGEARKSVSFSDYKIGSEVEISKV
ncbi:TSL-kinase interacting protein 1 [Heracleum sosnowskyi]|uniref:TSL-kinase interacting protein 1 n=1 Tax=Heracleum sosnowskyi TaxID=360622 RepID=A0AAD8J9D4_9APIA|nr:TSL-kinase interacting protein 1 [Heracleum sosnowskyi]